jgi:hypothetical protein
MSRISLVRRAGAAVVASALAGSLVAAAEPAHAVPASSPAGLGATWLAGQLNSHGLIHNKQFKLDDYGLTADTVLGLKAIGGHPTKVAEARKALAKHVNDYTTSGSDRYAGSIAKLLVLAQQTGGGARHFGGVDLVKRLVKRVADDKPIRGRIEDKSSFGDFANTLGQVLATRALLHAGAAAGPSVMRFLLEQQCGKGFFRLDFNADKTAADQSCGKGDAPDTDATAYAVVELSAVAKGHPALKRALGHATRWLKRHQRKHGAFGGAGPTSAANANSTGLAGWALLTTGKCGAARAAASWLADLQITGKVAGTKLAGERGAIAYDHAAKKAAKADGIDKTTRDQWRRATAQAAPALLALSRCRS